jgi:hypothetical protein
MSQPETPPGNTAPNASPTPEPTATLANGGAAPRNGPETARPPWWSDSWAPVEEAALQFPTEEVLDALIGDFWSDPLLRGMPRFYVGDNTVIVPASAVEYLRGKGHPFEVHKVISAGDLPAEEVNRIRREGGGW